MHKDKEENSHHDSHYRARELAALAAYDHHHLDGEMFLQVSTPSEYAHYVETARIYDLIWTRQILKMHIICPARALAIYRMPWWGTPASSSLSRSIVDLNSLTAAERIYRRERDLAPDPRSRNKWRWRVPWNIEPIYDAMRPW